MRFIVPHWNTGLNVPTVGDDVRILAPNVVHLHPQTPDPAEVRISGRPREANDAEIDRGRAIAALLSTTYADAVDFLKNYVERPTPTMDYGLFHVRLKNILENFKSALEYTAHFYAARCNPVPRAKDVFFPIASPDEGEASFRSRLPLKFPGLQHSHPSAIEALVAVQEFGASRRWLVELSKLANFNKHNVLSRQYIRDASSTIVHCDGVGIRLGELGLESVIIEEGAALEFHLTTGDSVSLGGPTELKHGIRAVNALGGELSVLRETRQLHYVAGLRDSLPTTLWVIAKNILRSVDQLCRAL